MEDNWPIPPVVLQGTVPDPEVMPITDVLEGDPEVKRVVTQTALVSEKPKLDEFMSKYSSWNRLKRGVAWLLRFVQYLHIRSKKKTTDEILKQGGLTVEECQAAERGIIQYVQRQAFPKEVDALNSPKQHFAVQGGRSRDRQLSLHKLNPVLIDGIMRVGGRLRNAPIDD